MKKVLALVLAVMMMSTFAFAGVAYVANDLYRPGQKVDVATFTNATDGDVIVDEDDHIVSKVTWEKNRSLVSSVKVDGNVVVIALKESFTMEKEAELKGKIEIRQKKADAGSTTRKTYEAAVVLKVNNNVLGKDDVGGIKLNTTSDSVSVAAADNTLYIVGATQGYGELSFGGNSFEVVGRVYDKEKLFLEYDEDGYDKDILLANEDVDAEIGFLSFAAKPTFKGLQTVSLYIDEDVKVYENKDGKLTEIKGKYDKEINAFTFTTRTLGDYVYADKALKSVAGSTAPSEGNPDTGANDVVGIATALAAVALVSAAAISLKK